MHNIMTYAYAYYNFINISFMHKLCMYVWTYSNSDKSIRTLYKVNFMIHTAATSCPQVNNKTVQNVCIESNAHCIKESNYSDLEV